MRRADVRSLPACPVSGRKVLEADISCDVVTTGDPKDQWPVRRGSAGKGAAEFQAGTRSGFWISTPA